MFPHFVPLSNPDELYDPHLRLILLSHDQLENLETVPLHYPDLLNGISCQSSFVNPRLYRCLKQILRLFYSNCVMIRHFSVTRFCARLFLFRRAINDSLNDTLATRPDFLSGLSPIAPVLSRGNPLGSGAKAYWLAAARPVLTKSPLRRRVSAGFHKGGGAIHQPPAPW